MVDYKKVIFIIVFILLLFVLLVFILWPREDITVEENSVCKVASITNNFLNGEPVEDISKYCNDEFASDECRLFFYDFMLFNIKNKKAEATDPNSPLNRLYYDYLNEYQDIGFDDFSYVLSRFDSGAPMDLGFDSPGLNAAITRDNSYCYQKQDNDSMTICMDELQWLNAKSSNDCDNISIDSIYLLCAYEFSRENYLSEMSYCNIE